MSAIAGIYHLNGDPVSIEHIQGVMGALQKFPADDIRVLHRNNLFLGCHAQWITPESIGEVLPYYDHERQLAITADCIIDNREELFEKLQIKKSLQKTMSDSELILHAYYKWGEETPKHLIGDFAFMIWDEKQQKLFGARDFSGARTLYYYHDHKRFAFCTTIEPLLSLPYVKKELNEQWLAEYLVVSGMIDTIDASLTPYKRIFQIQPSNCINFHKNEMKSTRYCFLDSDVKIKLKSDNEYVEVFQEVFQTAVNSRLRTHHKVGSQLSGGLDSGSVVSFAAKSLKKENKSLNTYSYIPPSDFKDFTSKYLLADERPFIKSTVEFVGGIHDQYLDFEGKDSYSEIDGMLDILEMPYKYFENSFWVKGMFEQAQKDKIGILLNGDRGNFSISWGFALEYYAILMKKIKWFRLLKELNLYSHQTGGARLRNLPLIAREALPILDRIFPQGIQYTLPSLINPDFAERMRIYETFSNIGMARDGWYMNNNIFFERKRHFQDLFQWNAGNTLSAKLSLRYKLWTRDPTNDLRVIRLCLSIPEDQYVQNGMDRALIRRSTENILPDKVRLNQKTRGVQGADWVHRMIPHWTKFVNEVKKLTGDKQVLEVINSNVIEEALSKITYNPNPKNATDPEHKILMRSIIIARFLKQFN